MKNTLISAPRQQCQKLKVIRRTCIISSCDTIHKYIINGYQFVIRNLYIRVNAGKIESGKSFQILDEA